MEKFDIEKYEYKAPSYRLRKNRPLFWIDEKKYARTLREEGWEAGLQAGRKEMAEAIARQLNLSVEEVLKMGEDSKL